MNIVIIRHGAVDYNIRKWSNSEEVNHDFEAYNHAPIISAKYHVPQGDYKAYYVSSLPRTLETAKTVFGERDYIATDLIDEVPISASISTKLKMPLAFWSISSRLQWLFNSKRQKESRKDTIIRAEKFVDGLILKGEDCALVTHGFFMITLLKVMKNKGFVVAGKTSGFSNGEFVVASNNKEQ